ncbi:hypothetical protein [Candidatus Lokiarchaeum ossiferum]|uniref:hypothetical protein n=1 Tax=Candidatus Lokiarchaeum ossiferum TaxID=2951803 RepID=UPI00352EFBF6
MKIDITEIEDGLEGNWWHYIKSSDFSFQTRIPQLNSLEANEDDILIHKQILEGESFPTKRFHLIMDGEAFQVEGNEIRETLARKLAIFIQQNKKLPFGCTYKKIQKNNTVIIQYNPNGFDSFQLKIKPEDMELEDSDIEKLFSSMETEKVNALATSEDATFTIDPITEDPLLEQVSMESGKSKVFVVEGKIIAIDLRKSYFQGNETIFYLLQLEGGKIAPDNKKNTLQRDFSLINAKCSENAMKKFELQTGNKVSFNGKVKMDKKLKLLVQNIRKFDKAT